MKKDRVTPSSAEDYGRRCKSIGSERHSTADLQDAMNHPDFKTSHHELLDRLATEYRQNKLLIERPPSLTIRVGTLRTVLDLRQAVLDAGCKINNWASDLMNQPAFAAGIVQAEEDIDFVFASNAELGFPNGCTRVQTYEAGLKLGWKLCQPSDAPEIRRNYLDQPDGDYLLPAINPIADSDGSLGVFYVERGYNGLWLSSNNGYPDRFWRGCYRWAFRRK